MTMTKSAALAFFKTQQKLADALGITQPSVCEWGEYPPPLQQIFIERLTNGKLKAESSVWPKSIRRIVAA